MRRKKNYVGLIIICSIALIVGIKSVYAYYYEDSIALNVVDTKVADIYPSFETKIASTDIDMRVRVYTTISTNVYTGSYSVPKGGTIKKVECTDNVTCTANTPSGTSKCYYIYDSTNGKITLENAGKAVCSFYF